MFRPRLAMIITAVALALSGCAFEDDGLLDDGETLHHRLGTRESLELEPTSLVGVAAFDGDGNPLPCLQPQVAGGTAVLRSTESGLLLVEDLEVELTDVVIEPGVIYNAPIHLTDIRLHLGTQIVTEPEWRESGLRADGSGSADLLLDWAVLDDSGEHYPLATQRLRDTEFAVTVDLDEETGEITAQVLTSVEGELASFANRIELSDFSMAVEAKTPSPDIE